MNTKRELILMELHRSHYMRNIATQIRANLVGTFANDYNQTFAKATEGAGELAIEQFPIFSHLIDMWVSLLIHCVSDAFLDEILNAIDKVEKLKKETP